MNEVIAPTLILPTTYAVSGDLADLADTETIADALEHTSAEMKLDQEDMKTIHVLATEIVPVAGAAGQLLCWVEGSPYPTANSNDWLAPLPVSALYWAAIGGGGGAFAPTAPVIEPGIGVNLSAHTIIFDFQMHHPFSRVVLQTPVPHATSYWLVQVLISGKGLGQ